MGKAKYGFKTYANAHKRAIISFSTHVGVIAVPGSLSHTI